MNSKTLQINSIADTQLDRLAGAPKSIVSVIIKRISGYLVRSEAEKARARYRAKHAAEASGNTDIVRDLPIEDKLRLGMYRFMD